MTLLTGLTDAEAWAALARLDIQDPALRAWLGRQQLKAWRARSAPLMFTPLDLDAGRYLVGTPAAPIQFTGTPFATMALSWLAAHPGRWCGVPGAQTRRALHASLGRAAERLAGVAPEVGALFLPAGAADEPGIRLRERDGRVQVRLTLPPGRILCTAPLA